MGAITRARAVTAAQERRRVVAAFVASLAVHASLLVAARGWHVADVAVPRVFVVTMLERGGGDGEPRAAAPGTGAGTPPLVRADTPPAVPAVAAVPPPIPPAAEHADRRARPPRRLAAAVAPAPRVSAPGRRPVPDVDAPAPAGAETAAPSGGGPSDGAAANAPSGGGPSDGAAAIAGDGAGSGTGRGAGQGSGRGDGSGAGAGDGLRALCASCPAPEYPARARRQGWQGTVDVALAIGGDGVVVDARVHRSSGYPPLDDVALDVARRSRFTVPAAGDGLRGELRYRFVLDAAVARR